jgi:hypothetical protein
MQQSTIRHDTRINLTAWCNNQDYKEKRQSKMLVVLHFIQSFSIIKWYEFVIHNFFNNDHWSRPTSCKSPCRRNPSSDCANHSSRTHPPTWFYCRSFGSTLPTLEEMGHGMESSAIQDFNGNLSQPPQNRSSIRQHVKFKDCCVKGNTIMFVWPGLMVGFC